MSIERRRSPFRPARSVDAGLLAAVLGLAIAAPGSAQQEVELASCYDGDTCTFRGLDRRVRLADIDTPEMDGRCRARATEARYALIRKLRHAQQIRVRVEEIGYYGRFIAQVWADSTNVNRWMRRQGYAVRYGEETCAAAGSEERAGTDPQGLPYDPRGPDRDCGDFSSQSVAQQFFEAAGGPARDPHRLDGDNDGRACESLPGGRSAPRFYTDL